MTCHLAPLWLGTNASYEDTLICHPYRSHPEVRAIVERIGGCLSALLLCALTFSFAGNQDAGASAVVALQEDWSEWLEEPSPDECTVETVNAEAIIYTIATAAANPPKEFFPAQVESIADLPSGEPATRAEAEGALSAIRIAIACFNAGSFGAVLAMFSEQGITQLMLGTGQFQAKSMTTEEIEQTIAFFAPIIDAPATPIAVTERTRLTEIRDVLLLEDGRILITTVGFSNIGEGLAFFILSEGDDHWEIDAAGSIGPIATPATT